MLEENMDKIQKGDIVSFSSFIAMLERKHYPSYGECLVDKIIYIGNDPPMFFRGVSVERFSNIELANKKQKALYCLFWMEND